MDADVSPLCVNADCEVFGGQERLARGDVGAAESATLSSWP